MDRKLNLKTGQEVAVRIEDMSNAARPLKGKNEFRSYRRMVLYWDS